jgi:membrane-bound lytic murein transglycosylase A
MKKYFFLFSLLLLALTRCASEAPRQAHANGKLLPVAVKFSALPGWADDNHVEALAVFNKSCKDIVARPDMEIDGRGPLASPYITWKFLCRRASLIAANDETQARGFFESAFLPYKATDDGDSGGFFTGYYEPLLLGSRTNAPPFLYPVYAPPPPGTPARTRAEIDLGALNGIAAPLLFVDDPVQLFFLHIQGSGRIQLENGQIVHIGFAGNNGQHYVAIGKVLAAKGLMKKEEVTMPKLRQWLYDHPRDMWQVMWENPSYVFFQETNEAGPFGTEHVALTPRRSLAVDINHVPLGMPVYVDTALPETPASPIVIERRLYIAQDTGGAIRGPVRGDIFFGFGTGAEDLAGRMKAGGEEYLLIPRAIALTLKKPD